MAPAAVRRCAAIAAGPAQPILQRDQGHAARLTREPQSHGKVSTVCGWWLLNSPKAAGVAEDWNTPDGTQTFLSPAERLHPLRARAQTDCCGGYGRITRIRAVETCGWRLPLIFLSGGFLGTRLCLVYFLVSTPCAAATSVWANSAFDGDLRREDHLFSRDRHSVP